MTAASFHDAVMPDPSSRESRLTGFAGAEELPVASQPSRWLHLDKQVLVLFLLPLVQWFVNPNWIFPPVGIDSWVYLGYQVDLPDHLRMFDGQYYGTRLTALLPGWLVHQVFSGVTANGVLHLGLYYACVFSLYGTLRRVVSPHGAGMAAALLGTHSHFMNTMGWDYVDSYGVTYFFLATWLLGTANRSAWWPLWIHLAGAALAALAIANVVYAILLPFPFLVYLVENRIRKGHPLWQGVYFLFSSSLAFTLLLCCLNEAITGRFWFFGPSIAWGQNFIAQNPVNPWRLPAGEWLPNATWIAIPLIAAIGSIAVLISSRHEPWSAQSLERKIWPVQMVAVAAMFLLFEATGKLCPLQFSFYSSLLIPSAFLSLGVQFDRFSSVMGRPAFLALAALSVAALFLGEVVELYLESLFPIPLLVAPALLGLFGLLLLCLPRIWAAGFLAIVFCSGMLNAHGHFFSAIQYGIKNNMSEAAKNLDRNRQSLYEAVAKTNTAVRLASTHDEVWFWYDEKDLFSSAYKCVASTYNFGFRMIGTQFPTFNETPSFVFDRFHKGGVNVVILTQDPDAMEKGLAALKEAKVEARPIGKKSIGKGLVHYELIMIHIPSKNP